MSNTRKHRFYEISWSIIANNNIITCSFTVHGTFADLYSISDYDSAGLRTTKEAVQAALRRFSVVTQTETSGGVERRIANN